MRTNVMKFAAIVLAAVLLLTAAISGLGIIYLTEYDLYRKTPAEALDSFLGTVTWEMAYYQAALHLAKQYGNLQEEEEWLLNVPSIPLGVENRVIGIEQPVIVSQNEKSSVENAGDVIAISYVIRGVEYPCVWKDGQTPVEGIGEPLYMERRHLQVNNKIEVYNMQYYYFDQEPILVTVLLRAEENPWQNAANLAYSLRNYLPMTCVSALVLCMVCMVYLCWVGGRKKGTEEILPGGLNRLPLDLYALVDCVAGFFLLMLLFEGVPALIA